MLMSACASAPPIQLLTDQFECLRAAAAPSFWHTVAAAILEIMCGMRPQYSGQTLPPLQTEGDREGSPEEEVGVSVACDLFIALSMHNLLDLMVDEVVEGVDVLLHQPPHLQHAVAMKRLTGTVDLV